MPPTLDRPSIVILDDDEEGRLDAIRDRLRQLLPNAHIRRHFLVREFLSHDDPDALPDVVLLDVSGMDLTPSEAIPEIHHRWPRLPVIILTAYPTLDKAVSYFHAGARAFLRKDRLTLHEVPTFQDSVEETRKEWETAADLIRQAIDEYRPIKQLLYAPRIAGFVKKLSGEIESPLADQVDFLLRMANSPRREVASLFPEVSNLAHSPKTTYEIPYYRAKSLRKTIFESIEPDHMLPAAKSILGQILKTIKEGLYNPTSKHLTSDEQQAYVGSFYTEKLRRRLQQTITMIESAANIPSIQKSGLASVLTAERIIIGDQEYTSPTILLNKIVTNKTALSRVTPIRCGQIHGDLHFDNILVDATVIEKPFIKLIDPRGFRNGSDFAYDIGKLLHSCHGKYDMIDGGYLTGTDSFLELDARDDKVKVGYLRREEWVDGGERGGSEDTVVTHRKIVTGLHYEVFDEIDSWLMVELKELMSDDDGWQERAYLNEALHFCTMGPFHLRRSPLKVFALYIRGVELMQDVARRLDVL